MSANNRCPNNGNTGLPISLNGTFADDLLEKIRYDTKLRISVSPRSVPRTLSKESGFIDEMGGDILYYGNVVYKLLSLQIAKTKTTEDQSPVQPGPANIQFYAIFKKRDSSVVGEDFILFNIPIVQQSSTKNSSLLENKYVDSYISELISVQKRTTSSFKVLFRKLKSFIEYLTCIEATDSGVTKTITFRVINSGGHIIKDDTWKTLKKYFKDVFLEFRLPKSIGYQSVAFKTNIVNGNMTITQWSSEGYPYINLINTSNDEFKKRFIYNPKPISTGSSRKKKRVESFINPGDDEYDDEEVDDDQQEQAPEEEPEEEPAQEPEKTDAQAYINSALDKIPSKNVFKEYITIIIKTLAIILAIITASFIIWKLSSIFSGKITTELIPTIGKPFVPVSDFPQQQPPAT
jgi:hypothetical protein